MPTLLRMPLRRAVTALLLALLLLVSLLSSLLPSATSAPGASTSVTRTQESAQADEVVYYVLGDPQARPKRIYMAYSSSPFMKKLAWRHWGRHKAVARGVYVSTCASCAGPGHRRAKVVMTGVIDCPEQGTRTYRRARVHVSEPDEGHTDTTYRLFAGCYGG